MSDNTSATEQASEKKAPETISVEGILELSTKQSGHLLDPKRSGRKTDDMPFVSKDMVKRLRLKSGSYIKATAIQNKGQQGPLVKDIETIDGLEIEQRRRKLPFNQLTSLPPEDRIRLENKDGRMTTRVVDLFCPVGKGQRGLIVAPPRTGKTTLLHDIACGVKENHPECHLIILLVDERPEEVTDFKRSIEAEYFCSSNDESLQSHTRVADLAVERAKRLVEVGKDVVLLVDSMTRLSRAHNVVSGQGRRTMSGGLDIRALEKPRQLFAAARNTEEAGSLTIIATALIETGSRMDDMIFQEFKGTGNMELVLDRKIAQQRLFPAINVHESGTRREELILPRETLEKINFFRRAVAGSKADDAAEAVIGRLSKTRSNLEFLSLLNK